MDHPRKQIKNAVAELLGSLSSSADIFISNSRPIDEDKLPAVYISIENDTLESVSSSDVSRHSVRRASLIVKAAVIGAGNVDEDLDSLSAEIESEVLSSSVLKGIVLLVMHESTDFSYNSDVARDIAVAEINFSVMYQLIESNPQ